MRISVLVFPGRITQWSGKKKFLCLKSNGVAKAMPFLLCICCTFKDASLAAAAFPMLTFLINFRVLFSASVVLVVHLQAQKK